MYWMMMLVAATPWLSPSPIEEQPSDKAKTRFPPLAQAGNGQDRSSPEGDVQPKNQQQSENAKLLATEKAVLAFVGQHQPKLLELMSFLKVNQPAQYQRALREMARSTQRLETLSKRDDELHAIELKLWQTRSQLRLLAAEISVAGDDKNSALQARLRKLVEKEFNQNLARLRLQRERAAKQLKQLNQQLQQRQAEQEAVIAKTVKTWQNRIARQVPKPKKKDPQD